LFAGHPLGLIVLPIMLFHQIQLMTCAVLARRYAVRREASAKGIADKSAPTEQAA
jgi:sodium/bile acid cotransporter 7